MATNSILSCPHCLTRNLFSKDAFPSTARQRFMTLLPLCTIVIQLNPNPCLFFFFFLPLPPDFSSIVLHATTVTTKRKQQTPSCYKALLRMVTRYCSQRQWCRTSATLLAIVATYQEPEGLNSFACTYKNAHRFDSKNERKFLLWSTTDVVFWAIKPLRRGRMLKRELATSKTNMHAHF